VPSAGAGGRLAAGLVGWLTLFAIGWSGLLIPSLIRSIEATFAQTDAGMGAVYLGYAIAYGGASFSGGWLTERLGRRRILGGAALVHGLGVAGLGLAPSWPWFIVAAMALAAGAGCLDGGANGLVLDVYREGRGRAMNLLHVAFSLGALSAPLVVGAVVEGGSSWQSLAVVSGIAVSVLALAYALVPMPSGRRRGTAAGEHAVDPSDASGGAGIQRLLTGPLLLLGFAIAAYVASEVGVSDWLVRFLEPAPLTTATLALSLYWAGLTVGRLISSAIADRFDHLRFTIACALVLAALVVVAVLAPSLPLSIAAFALAGVASGPVFPMIVALGGERYPERSAAVGGSLTGMAVVGSTVYPPTMGFLSVTVGLTIAMLGTALLAIASAVALAAFGRAADDRAMEPRLARRQT
jgi:MFS transporter, FHS family, glucose/mannose:H+ symporter